MARRNRAQDGCVSRAHSSHGTRARAENFRATVPATSWQDQRPTGLVDTQRLFEKVKAIADTGFLVGFGNGRDRYHAWALELARQIKEPLLTCEAVLAETVFHLGDVGFVLDFVRRGLVQPAFVISDHFTRLAELAARYADRSPDLADLCLIRMSELHPRHPVITTDVGDFRIYRRGRREAIPLIVPPGL